ncbi:MAG: alpha/beta fold hydrolase [Rhodanobacteraceae bacterium]
MSVEEILELGPQSFGLLTRATSDERATAIMLLNAGNVHRSGPFRLSTRLARALASSGYPVFRFDLPNIGDTLPVADRPLTQVTEEVLDRVQHRTGCSRFVVGGLCAGADRGWQLALKDPRVTGVLLLDGLARGAGWFRLARLARALRKPPAEWLTTLRRQLGSTKSPLRTTEGLRDWPARGTERTQIKQLLARGTKIFALFTGGTSYFLHPRQFFATFGEPARDRAVRFEHWPDSDHLFCSESYRQRLIVTIKAWVVSQFPE